MKKGKALLSLDFTLDNEWKKSSRCLPSQMIISFGVPNRHISFMS